MTSAVLNSESVRGVSLLPSGEGGAEAPDEGSPPHDSVNLYKSWSGLPSPGAARHPLPRGEGSSENGLVKMGARRAPLQMC
jgi:hypothetical protein